MQCDIWQWFPLEGLSIDPNQFINLSQVKLGCVSGSQVCAWSHKSVLPDSSSLHTHIYRPRNACVNTIVINNFYLTVFPLGGFFSGPKYNHSTLLKAHWPKFTTNYHFTNNSNKTFFLTATFCQLKRHIKLSVVYQCILLTIDNIKSTIFLFNGYKWVCMW